MTSSETFVDILSKDGKKNSIAGVDDVILLVMKDKERLEELYQVMFHEDAWVRMRAADAFEKVCRIHPDWITPYVDRIQSELADSQQASIRWHIAQMYEQVELDDQQKVRAIEWLKDILSSSDIDWIVSANCMSALAYFARRGEVNKETACVLFKIQTGHTSNAVKKRADYLLNEFL